MASPSIPREKNRRADVVRQHYVDLHKILSNFREVLSSVTMRCFQDSLIDMNTKTAITSSNGQDGSSILLDHIHSKLEQSEDYLPLVLNIFKQEVSLKDIVSKMESFVAENVKASETVSEQTEYQMSLVPKWAYPVLSTLQYKMIPVYRTIEQFRMNKRNEAELYTDHFYTAQGGYKMTLRVYPNGVGSGKGTHISAYICLMKGENDHTLPFPFSGIFTIKLLNWKQDTGHVVKSVVFNETTPLKNRQQVTTGQRAATGWGHGDFLSHTKLMEESSDHQYLYEDKLCFQILFEPINQTGPPLPSWCDVMYTNSSTPPCTRTLYNYTAYKKTNRDWYSLPFYSRDKGYKLMLRVGANGDGSGIGTHLSLCVHLLKGEYDDQLQWPFNANITVQLLNWSGDNGHEEDTIPHHTAPLENRTRVTEGDRAPNAFGPIKFISHSVLESVTSDVQFITDNKICFKIIKISIID